MSKNKEYTSYIKEKQTSSYKESYTNQKNFQQNKQHNGFELNGKHFESKLRGRKPSEKKIKGYTVNVSYSFLMLINS